MELGRKTGPIVPANPVPRNQNLNLLNKYKNILVIILSMNFFRLQNFSKNSLRIKFKRYQNDS